MYEDDIILPEGFNPDLGDANFNEDGSLAEVQTATEAPTTETTVTETPTEEIKTEAVETPNPTISQEPATQEPTQVEQPVEPQKVKVKFNHEERELTLEEASLLAQKGMAFDKIDQKSKDQAAKLARYEEIAKLFGYENTDAMMDNAQNDFVDTKVKDMVEQGVPEPMARFLANQDMDKAKSKMAAQTPAVPTLSEERKTELEEFNAAYPDVTKIPDEVFKMHSEGIRLKAAYGLYQQQQAQKAALDKLTAESKAAQEELAILKQNQAAAAKGPVTGTVGKPTPEGGEQADDPFLKGFNSDF